MHSLTYPSVTHRLCLAVELASGAYTPQTLDHPPQTPNPKYYQNPNPLQAYSLLRLTSQEPMQGMCYHCCPHHLLLLLLLLFLKTMMLVSR